LETASSWLPRTAMAPCPTISMTLDTVQSGSAP
jgi:hypothetical protein